MTVLYDNTNPASRRRTRVLLDSETLLPLIVSEQDVRPIVEAAKRDASNFDPIRSRTGSDEWTRVARIPMVMWARLERLGITKDDRALNKWLDSREARALRCDDGRRL